MTTEEAFESLITTKGIHKKLGINSNQLAMIRFNFRRGALSLDKMEELLLLAGWSKVPEYWHRPK